MPSRLLAAGLDARGLLLYAPVLQRDRHVIDQKDSARDLLEDLAVSGAGLVVLGTDLHDLPLAETLRQIRSFPATRHVSVLVVIPADEPHELDTEAAEAGANAVLRRPLDPHRLEAWIARLLSVPRRVEARVPVQGQVVGTPRSLGVHFYGLTRNLSVNGMLLASPLRLPDAPDLDLEFTLPDLAPRLRALGRVVREAREVAWPYLGYGVEFLFVPPESHEAIAYLVQRGRPDRGRMGIHATVRRDDWVYEILEPVPHSLGWEAEIRRGPRQEWRPGLTGPFYVVEGPSRDGVLRTAREFLRRHVESR